MEVILREEVANLGSTGEVVKVRPGFARNYLLPRGLAVLADRRNMRALDHEKRVATEKRDRDRRAAEGLAQRLTAARVVVGAHAGDEGKLFGSVTNQDIERGLAALGFVVERRKIRLDEPIKQIGEHSVAVQLGGGVTAHVTVVVEPEKA